MGIVEKELSNFRKGEEYCKVELNKGGIIHLHIGGFRLDLTKDEFKTFVQNIEESKKELEDIKNGLE